MCSKRCTTTLFDNSCGSDKKLLACVAKPSFWLGLISSPTKEASSNDKEERMDYVINHVNLSYFLLVHDHPHLNSNIDYELLYYKNRPGPSLHRALSP